MDLGTATDAGAIAVATTLLVVATAVQYVDCAQNIGVGLLRGLDDTTASFRMTLIGYWIVGLPTAWLVSHGFGLGATGVWLGLLTGLGTTAALLLRRFTEASPHVWNRPPRRPPPESLPAAATIVPPASPVSRTRAAQPVR
ncbi:MAG TPA: hypothetical protein VF755_28245 [Catenuloplanes sp.]